MSSVEPPQQPSAQHSPANPPSVTPPPAPGSAADARKLLPTRTHGGGWQALQYSFKLAAKVGPLKMYRSMRSSNACKTCAVGMGGQIGGMVNEGGAFPEVCKKSFQAMASDMQPALPDDFFDRYDMNRLRAMSPRQLELSGRITRPYRFAPGDDRYRPCSWDEAISRTADALKAATAERSFWYASGRSSNEAGFLLQLLARLTGSNYVNNCSYYCHQATGAGLASTIGSGVGTIQLQDLDGCDLYVLIGANPASNHPRLMTQLMKLRRRGGRVVVINPAKEVGLVNFKVPSDIRSMLTGTEIANLYIQPNIGGDLALMTGVAKVVFERNGQDRPFIAEHTDDFDEFRQQVESTDWPEIVEQSGVERAQIEQLATWYLQSENTVFAWAMGITHHAHGVENVQMISNLALLRGMVGREKAGLMPLRGHSNVQGVGSVGVTPQLKAGIIERYRERLGVEPPTQPGYDTMQCMLAAGRGEMDAALLLGGNLFGSNPDADFAREALSKIGLITQLSTTLNTGHAHGLGKETILLPVLPRDEEPQATTQESMFSYVRLSDGGTPRFEGPRSEVSILCDLGRRLLPSDEDGRPCPVDWTELESHAAVRKLIADLIPGYEEIGRVDEDAAEAKRRAGFGTWLRRSVGWGMAMHLVPGLEKLDRKLAGESQPKAEFHVGGRHPRDAKFNTDNGRAKFRALPLPRPADGEGAADSLRMMTVRSEGQFNTVVYDDYDLYRGQERRDVVMMAKEDMDRLGLKNDQSVRVSSRVGEMRALRARRFDVRPGNAIMYYPEANVLVPKEVDPVSKTPAFKKTMITVRPEAV